LKRTGHELRLTPASLETLAVIAYKQPIMRAEVEKVRGVACSEIIRQLMEKGLVRGAGRHDSLGRPQLYGTTKRFLQAFGLNTLKDLPEVEALRKPNP
jgi:segregation and condensation protein B